jgi:glycosyltransferase involved in cell wall biosynthesis
MPKIAIIGSKGIPARYGGFETLAENLVKHLRKRCEFIVYCSGPAYKEHPERHLGAELKYLPLDANGAQSIPYDIWSMIHASRHADIMLVLGVSGCIFLPILKLFYRGKVMVNLDGMDWKRPKWGRFARAFLKLSETVAAKFADQLIADNDAIHDYIGEIYGRDSFLVEYGGDNARSEIPEKSGGSLSVVALHKHGSDDDLVDTGFDKYAIAVCRIEPENHIHVILEAFSQVNTLPLVFLGNWSNSEYGKTLRRRYRANPNLLLLDPIFEPRKLFALRSNASLYIHGHSSGGTNPSLVESMSLGLPVMTYDVVFNRATTENMALYFDSTASLIRALRQLDTLDLKGNARNMRELAKRRYSWATIASKYATLFALPAVTAPDATVEQPVGEPSVRPAAGAEPLRPMHNTEASAKLSRVESSTAS